MKSKVLALLSGKNLFAFVSMLAATFLLTNGLNSAFVDLGLQLTGWQQFVWGYGLQNVVLLAVLYLWFYRRFPTDRQKITWQIGHLFHLIGYVLLIFASYLALIALMYLIKKYAGLDLLPGLNNQRSLIAITGDGVGLWIAFLAAVIIAPIIEEYVFRGWGMICLPVATRPYLSIVLNGLIFGICHFEPSLLIPLTYLGIMIAWVRYRSGSILPGIIFHLINNSLALLADYLLIHQTT